MPFPVMAGVVAGTSLISAMTAMSNYRATKRATDYASMYYQGAYDENSRFWQDYMRAHHWRNSRSIKYPYRTGYNYNLLPLQNAGVRALSSKNAVYRSLAGGIVPFGLYKRNVGYRGGGTVPSVMYG